ncbi:MAG: DUF4056 domain-containing protein, partial [Bacteroidales bacterium]|nr:DUF4056 domain-containing protein [Bacteroidales bacterium]
HFNKKNCIVSILIFVIFTSIQAKKPTDGEINIQQTPPRIIRVCCAFGTDLNLFGVPFFKINHVTSIDQLGNHVYMGHKDEGNGIIYTRNGGFIDLGHLRDQADWTKYLYHYLLNNKNKGEVEQKLGIEGGIKKLLVDIPGNADSATCLQVAGRIAYDLSLWHELSTWFGASSVPMMPERYSSFSVEDVYSNLLGVTIGIKAIQSELPYNQAMTKLLRESLENLSTVTTEQETCEAFESVEEIWWSRSKRLPHKEVIIERDIEVIMQVRPWLVPDTVFGKSEPHILDVPTHTNDGRLLSDYYSLQIDLNYKFPVKELFPDRDHRLITQNDFEVLLRQIERDLKIMQNPTYSDHAGILKRD